MRKRDRPGKAGSYLKDVIWLLSYSLVGKGASLAAQVALGWLLTKEDFGLWAIVVSISTTTSLMRNGGTTPLLIQRGAEYEVLAGRIVSLSIIFNCTAMILLLLGGPIATYIYKSSDLWWMISIIALELPFATFVGAMSAKLSIDRKFDTLSKIGMASNIIRQGSMVALAYLGFGPASFVIPVVIESLFNFILYRITVKTCPKPEKLSREDFKMLFSKTRWILLSAFVIGLAWQGDYFIIGYFEKKEQLGVYFFAMQLVNSVAVIFTNTAETYLLPVLSSIANSVTHQKAMFLSAVKAVSFVGFSIAGAGYLLIDVVVTSIWKGRWDAAIPMLKIMIMTVPAWLLVSLGRSLLESRGHWRGRFIHMGLFAIGSMLVAGFISYENDILITAKFVTTFRVSFSVLQLLLIATTLSASISHVFKVISQTGVYVAASLICAESIWEFYGPYLPNKIVATLGVYLFMIFALTYLFKRDEWLGVLRQMKDKATQ